MELFYGMKSYLNKISQEKNNFQINSISYAFEIDDFVIMIYSALKWHNYLIDGFSKYFEEKYQEKRGEWVVACRTIINEVIPNYLYTYRFCFESKHTECKCKMFYNHVPLA